MNKEEILNIVASPKQRDTTMAETAEYSGVIDVTVESPAENVQTFLQLVTTIAVSP